LLIVQRTTYLSSDSTSNAIAIANIVPVVSLSMARCRRGKLGRSV
jgi:hypothetical protein